MRAKYGLQECVYLFFLCVCVHAIMSLIFVSFSRPILSQGVHVQEGSYRCVSFDVFRCVCMFQCESAYVSICT